MNKTTFAIWLEGRGDNPSAFAVRHGISKAAAYALAGIRSHRSPEFFRTSTLERIEAETGIAAQVLYGDWCKVEPRPARKYTRRGGGGVAIQG